MVLDYPEFEGKRVLITGGTQGIGKAVAKRLARQGSVVYLNYARNEKVARETLEEFKNAGYDSALCQADLGVPDAVEQMLEELHRSGPLDLLVCNAAYQEKKGFFETDLALLQRTLNVNILANFQIIQKVACEMIATGRPGRMVMCSSGHGTMAFKGTFAYDVSKAALNHFMRCAALELIEHKIRLNAVDIGWTHTPGERRWFSQEEQDRLSRSIPIGRAAQADEIAAVIEFLLCNQAGYVVGSLYTVDGGFVLRPNPST
ncbi:MAG: SDR family oxidoreductase [Verrucomicrobia bacterium]|nr:SDR family oxidoreductase [Verrucomicrobiota bacterium]